MTSQSGSMPSGASEASMTGEPSGAAIDLYWLPLGAGGHFVRLNGRIYEAIRAFHDRRRAFDLYHSALQVRVPEGRYVIEMAWPIPDSYGASRGVVVEGPVGSHRMERFRPFPLRSPPMAGRGHSGHPRSGGKSAALEQRPGPSA